jgi:cobalt-zinc-cadmium efflux system outer membrane protein
VQIAFANNRDIQATLEELGIARADYIAASTVRNPLFSGEIRFPGVPVDPFEMTLTQTVVDLFQLKNRRRLGRAQFEAARVRVGGAIVQFASQVRGDYYDLLAARQLLARQETITKAQQAATDLAARQHAAGNISDLDLENEQARYEQVKLEHARAQLDELEARERVIGDLGLVERAELKLPGEFPALPLQEMTPAEAEARVATSRLDIRIAQRDIEAAQRIVSNAKSAPFDDADVGVHYEREPDGKTTTGPALTVPIPIFDRGAAPRARARAMLRQAQQRLAALTATSRSEARAAAERLAEARARTAYLRDVVLPRRQRILNLTQLEYNAMQKGVFQLIEARASVASAQREEVLATRDYWTARTELEAALLGVSGFRVRPEAPARERRPDLFAPAGPQASKANEGQER